MDFEITHKGLTFACYYDFHDEDVVVDWSPLNLPALDIDSFSESFQGRLLHIAFKYAYSNIGSWLAELAEQQAEDMKAEFDYNNRPEE